MRSLLLILALPSRPLPSRRREGAEPKLALRPRPPCFFFPLSPPTPTGSSASGPSLSTAAAMATLNTPPSQAGLCPKATYHPAAGLWPAPKLRILGEGRDTGVSVEVSGLSFERRPAREPGASGDECTYSTSHLAGPSDLPQSQGAMDRTGGRQACVPRHAPH